MQIAERYISSFKSPNDPVSLHIFDTFEILTICQVLRR